MTRSAWSTCTCIQTTFLSSGELCILGEQSQHGDWMWIMGVGGCVLLGWAGSCVDKQRDRKVNQAIPGRWYHVSCLVTAWERPAIKERSPKWIKTPPMRVKDKEPLLCLRSEINEGTRISACTHTHTHARLHTPFLHKAEEVVQELFPLWVSIQFIQLWGGRNKRRPLVFYLKHPCNNLQD